MDAIGAGEGHQPPSLNISSTAARAAASCLDVAASGGLVEGIVDAS